MSRQWLFACMICAAVVISSSRSPAAAEPAWRVGTARVKITPQKLLWMAGFGSRTHPARGTLHDLWVKALALEAADGSLGVVVTCDLLGIPKRMYDSMSRQLKERAGLERRQVMFTSSHTHCGPVLWNALYDVYPMDEKQRLLVEEYSAALEEKIVAVVIEALSRRTAATLSAAEGTARFAVNRRTNRESELPKMIARGEPFKGPSDFTVPVLAVRTPEGDLRAAVFGYAAHTSTLYFDEYLYRYSGDYAGFTQISLEKSHPGALAMFWQGCGSDQSAAPRGTLELCVGMAGKLTSSVEDVLAKPMRPIGPQLRTALEFIKLDFHQQPTASELKALAAKGGYRGRWAKRLLGQLDEGKPFAKSYPEYPVQVWRLGADQLWITLGGEVAVNYALLLEEKYGPRTWVSGYTNDVMAYIPSKQIWKEGGYQAGAFYVYGLPAVSWTPDIEERIVAAVDRLVNKLK